MSLNDVKRTGIVISGIVRYLLELRMTRLRAIDRHIVLQTLDDPELA